MSTLRIAFQGEPGAFSEEAIRASFGERSLDTLPQHDFAGIARAVLAGDATLGLLPVENSIAGGVAAAYDVLAGADVVVVAEVIHPIRICLLGVPGATIDGLRRVLSHPIALAQCQRFLAGLRSVDVIAVHDTAGAARLVAERRDPTSAAAAGRGAAERYGLVILAEDIQDRTDNQTRFFVIARADAPLPRLPAGVGPRRTALLLETEHRPGALVAALVPLAEAGINLSRIESRPADRPWHYRFFLECDADADSPASAEAIADVAAQARSLRVLGSFTRLA